MAKSCCCVTQLVEISRDSKLVYDWSEGNTCIPVELRTSMQYLCYAQYLHIPNYENTHTHLTHNYTKAILIPHVIYTLKDKLYAFVTNTAQYKHIK